MKTYPVSLSKGELAEIRGRAHADQLTTWPAYVDRLLATIEADRERISQLEEAADIVLEVEARGLRDIRLRSSSEGAWLSAISVLRHARMGWKDYIEHLMMALKRAEPR